MPLYDCMLLLKPRVPLADAMVLIQKIGKHVYRRNGVLTDVKKFGMVHLGYGIKKLDGRYYQGQMMQMTMMAPPSLNNELHYLNKEDRLLRWLLIKHRDFSFGDDLASKGDFMHELSNFKSRLFQDKNSDDDTNEDDDDDYEYQVDQIEENK
ncbi:ribosomal protein [Lithospermum erythrorhizon]|uniref:Ribosomal protein n=1 Tax=Lithospermum erythrorhizon TaxID=34254 RepID=A0AAV3RZD6_LITER